MFGPNQNVEQLRTYSKNDDSKLHFFKNNLMDPVDPTIEQVHVPTAYEVEDVEYRNLKENEDKEANNLQIGNRKGSIDSRGLTSEKAIIKYALRPSCNQKCRLKCSEKIPLPLRESINKTIVQLSWSDKRFWIINHVKLVPIKRRRVELNVKKRLNQYKYLMPDEKGNDVEVCKIFFLATLGFESRNDKIIKNALSNVDKISGITRPDGRGKYFRPATEKTVDMIRTHVESFHPAVSHYCRAHAPNRRYLPSELNVKFMHQDFNEKHPFCSISYDRYRAVFLSMNIAFTKLGNEECEVCETFIMHNPAHKRDNLDHDCDTCQKWSSHHVRYTEARKEYQDDVAHSSLCSNTKYYSVDLQKVIMLPKIDGMKIVMFTRRIVAFNLSFVPLGSTTDHKQPIAMIWHEGVAGRNCEDITSAFHRFFLANRDTERIILWLDNCSAQNKNWCLYTFLIQIINSDEIETQVIELKYFESGHTFMSADTFHHQVELSMSKMKNVYDFQDFQNAVQNANSGRVDVKSLKPDDFTKWLDRSSLHKMNKNPERPRIRDMKIVQFKRGKMNLFYKLSSDSEAIELDFLLAKILKTGFPVFEKQRKARGVINQKKDDIINKIVPLMPRSRRVFWHSLESCDVKDLISEYDEEIQN